MKDLHIAVLCVGYACYDLVFSVDHHPGPDEKCGASAFISCGGGTAANAAMTSARLGCPAALAAYLGNDVYGELHLQELQTAGVATDLVVQGDSPTPLSVVLVKPDGRRSLVAYGRNSRNLARDEVDIDLADLRAILLDGHQLDVALPLAHAARERGIPLVLDADAVHAGTRSLMGLVDYLVASEKFAREFTSLSNMEEALQQLGRYAPAVVITLGERGLIWRNRRSMGRLPAFPIHAVDTTGAGDTFHGAFVAAVAANRPWDDLLRYASAAGALCCTRHGARLGIPTGAQVEAFLAQMDYLQ